MLKQINNMKKLLPYILVLITFKSVYSAECSPTPNSLDKKNPHKIYFAPEIFVFDLNTDFKDINVSGCSAFSGLRLRYEYLKPKALYVGLDWMISISFNSFDAKLGQHNFPTDKGKASFGNSEVRFGYTAAFKNKRITPFLGIGAYVFANSHDYFYFRERMSYYAAGMRSLFELRPDFSWGLNWKVFRTDDTEQKFQYKTNTATITIKNNTKMWGGEIGLPLTWEIGCHNRWNMELEPYFLKLAFSELQNIYGARLGFRYRF